MVQERRSFPNSPTPRRQSPQYWRWLLPPMLLASLGLHGLILFAPVGSSDNELVPPPDPEEDGIAITKIEAPQPRSRPDVPANTGTVKTTRPTPAVTPATPPPARPAQASRASRPSTAQTTQPSTNRQTGKSATSSTASTTPSTSTPPSSPPTVPDLSTVEAVQPPNPVTPDVPSDSPQPTVDLAASNVEPFEEYIKLFESYNGVKISDEQAEEFRALWLDSFRDRGHDFANIDIKPLQDIDPIPYAANICLPAPPTTAQVLVLVDAAGEVDDYQQFIQRTGYRDFDTEVSQRLESYPFPDADQPQAYLAEVSVDYDPDDCEWPPKVDQLPNEYFTVLDNYVGPQLTTTQEAEMAQAAWLTTLGDNEQLDLPHKDELKPEPLEVFDAEVEYPLAICLPIEPVDAQWGVVVNPDGHLATEPEPLRSTGYKNFDDRAQDLVTTFQFPETAAPTLYVVEVPVAYNSVNCQPLDSEEFEIPAMTTVNGRDDASDRTDAETSPPPDSRTTASVDIAAFDTERQTQLLAQGRENIEADSIGSLNSLPGIVADSVAAGWPQELDQSCFLDDLSPEQGLVPVDDAEDAIVLSVNTDDAPISLSRFYRAEVSDAGDYCGAPLIQLSLSRIPQLFASIIGFGAGNSNTLVVLWPSNPRDD